MIRDDTARLLQVPATVERISRRAGAETRLNVLLVDDDPSVLRGLRRMLSIRWNVDTADSAVEAAGKLAGGSYYAVISDLEMPGRDGIWLLNHVRVRLPRIVRVMVSGAGVSRITPHIHSGLVEHFFSKPVDRDSLMKALEPSESADSRF